MAIPWWKMDAGKLLKRIGNICPISEVSLGDPTDKTKWKVTPDLSATVIQVAALTTFLAATDPTMMTPDEIIDGLNLTKKDLVAMLFILQESKLKGVSQWAMDTVAAAYARCGLTLGINVPTGVE